MLLALDSGLDQTMVVIGLKAFAPALVGGLDSLFGALVGAVIVAAAEVFAIHYVADARTSESTGFSESWRGILGSAEHLNLAEGDLLLVRPAISKNPPRILQLQLALSDKNPRVYH
jgi:hypothetical protein